MTTEMLQNLATQIARKISLYNNEKSEWTGNARLCPYFSEYKGMIQTLKTLGIEYEFEFDDEYNETAIIVCGQRAEIKNW